MTDEQLYQARQEGRSYRDIADEHGLSTDSVRSRISRHNRLIKQIIDLRTENQQLREQLAAKDDGDGLQVTISYRALETLKSALAARGASEGGG